MMSSAFAIFRSNAGPYGVGRQVPSGNPMTSSGSPSPVRRGLTMFLSGPMPPNTSTFLHKASPRAINSPQSKERNAMPGALDGLKVIDLSRVLGGPYCAQMLADHGADVIKIEPPQGDEVRDWGPPFRDDAASYFVGINRNKRGLALDLAKPEGREVLMRLLEGADVLIHNFKSGTLEKWGIGYADTLAKKFPRLIYCHITGFGPDGPLGGLPGYDAAVQAVSGLMSINGTEESGPVRIGTPIVDIGTGLNAAIGILMAINDRHKTGKGQGIDVSLYDSAVSFLHPHAANYLMSGKPPKRIGNAHPNISPYDS